MENTEAAWGVQSYLAKVALGPPPHKPERAFFCQCSLDTPLLSMNFWTQGVDAHAWPSRALALQSLENTFKT